MTEPATPTEADHLAAAQALAIRACEVDPAGVARTLQAADPSAAWATLASLPPAGAARVLERLSPPMIPAIAASASVTVFGELLATLQPPSVARLLRAVPLAARDELLGQLSAAVRATVIGLISHTPDRVGAHVSLRGLHLDTTTTAGDVLARLRAGEAPDADALFVLDDRGHLRGRVTVRRLLSADADAPVGDLADRRFPAVGPAARIADVVRDPTLNTGGALPVVDAEGRFIGVIGPEVLALRPWEPDAIGGDGQVGAELGELFNVGAQGLLGWARLTLGEPTPREPGEDS